MDAAVVTMDICLIWILSFSCCSREQTAPVLMMNRGLQKE